MLGCLKESGGIYIFEQNTSFSKTEFMRLYEKIVKDLEIYLITGIGEE